MRKIFSLFLSPFNPFSPNLLFGHILAPPPTPGGREGGGSNRKIYTPAIQHNSSIKVAVKIIIINLLCIT